MFPDFLVEDFLTLEKNEALSSVVIDFICSEVFGKKLNIDTFIGNSFLMFYAMNLVENPADETPYITLDQLL